MGGNSMNCDLQYTIGRQSMSTDVYYSLYTDTSFFQRDIGYGILMELFKYIGFTYKYFRLSLSIIEFFLLYRILRKYSQNIVLYCILYSIYPFCYDVAAQRNTLGMFIWFYAFSILVEGKSGCILKYIIITIVSATIQKTFLIYLPLAFMWDKRIALSSVRKLNYRILTRNKIKYGIVYLLLFLSFAIGLNRDLFNFVSKEILNSFFKDDERGSILENSTKIFWIILWAEQLINFLLIKYVGNKLTKDSRQRNLFSFYKSVYVLNIYGFFFLPIYVMSGIFFRLSKNIIPLNLIVYTNYLYKYPKSPLIIVIITYQLFLFFLHIYFGGNWLMTLFDPIVENNWILGIGEKAI